MGDARLDSALDLMRRMSPSQTSLNLGRLISLCPDLTDSLLQTVDQPLKASTCASTGSLFLLSDFNRDGDSFRSPYCNEYSPPLTDGVVPSPALRALELQMLDAWRSYARAYHESSVVASVYCWDTDDGEYAETGSFAASWLAKKQLGGEDGSWDAIHVVDVKKESGDRATYTLTSTVMVSFRANGMELGGSLTRQRSASLQLRHGARSHVVNIGTMIQDEELRLRTQIEDVYFGKTAEIAALLHSTSGAAERDARKNLAMGLSAALANRKA